MRLTTLPRDDTVQERLGFGVSLTRVKRRNRQQINHDKPDNGHDRRKDPFMAHDRKYARAVPADATMGRVFAWPR